MDPIQQHLVNPSDISLFEDLNAKSTTQIMVDEDNKENVGHPIETYLMENSPNSSIPAPPMRRYWKDVSPDVRYQQPTERNIWEQVLANQRYQDQLGVGPSQDMNHQRVGPSQDMNHQQQYLFRPVPPPHQTHRLVPPPHQMPMHHQFIQEKQEIVEPDVYAPRAPRRKIGDDGRMGFAWTYAAMIAAALLNSPGPQKMERLYAFMETHFIARLVKKENGTNDKDGWRKCIRHTVAYGKQFQSFAPANMTRGKLYSINPEKLNEVQNMLRNKYEDLREDMTRPELLEAMLAGELQQEPVSKVDQAPVQDVNSTDSTNQGASGKPVRQRRKRGPYNKNKKDDQVNEDEEEQQVTHPLLASYLSNPPQLPPYWMGQFNPHTHMGYPFNGYPFEQKYLGQNYMGYPRDTNTPGSLSTNSTTDESEICDLDRAQSTYVRPATSTSTSGLPGINTFNHHYHNYAPAQNDQFPDDFLQD